MVESCRNLFSSFLLRVFLFSSSLSFFLSHIFSLYVYDLELLVRNLLMIL